MGNVLFRCAVWQGKTFFMGVARLRLPLNWDGKYIWKDCILFIVIIVVSKNFYKVIGVENMIKWMKLQFCLYMQNSFTGFIFACVGWLTVLDSDGSGYPWPPLTLSLSVHLFWILRVFLIPGIWFQILSKSNSLVITSPQKWSLQVKLVLFLLQCWHSEDIAKPCFDLLHLGIGKSERGWNYEAHQRRLNLLWDVRGSLDCLLELFD